MMFFGWLLIVLGVAIRCYEITYGPPDHWVNVDLLPLENVWAVLRVEQDDGPELCGVFLRAGRDGYTCTRLPGRHRRHVAGAESGVAAAWPGDHVPTLDDFL